MLGNLGYVELSIGDIDIARGHLLESLDMARELNDHYGVVYETFNLGLASYLSGSLDAAADLFVESLHLAKRMQMKQSIAYALIGVAMAGSGADGMSRSVRLHGAAEQALTVLGETIEPLESGLRDRDCGRLRSAMGAEAFEAEYAAGRALTFEQVLALALGNQTLCRCLCPAERRPDRPAGIAGHARHHQWWSLCGGTRGEGTVWRGFPAVRSRRHVKLTRAGCERRVVRGGYGLRGPADRQTRGNHQGSPWGDAAVELLSVIPDTTSRRRQ
jgi:hypothetical protein